MLGLMSNEFISEMLSPVSESCPAGEYLKANRPHYRALRNAYNLAQDSLHKLSLNPTPSERDELLSTNKNNWLTLQDSLIDTLLTRSRDMEMLSWLAMSQLFTDQPYTKLARVLSATSKVIDRFWPEIQPWLPDDLLKSEDDERRLIERVAFMSRPLATLFGDSEASCQILIPLRMLPLVDDLDYVGFLRHQSESVDINTLVEIDESKKDSLLLRIQGMTEVLESIHQLDETLKQHFAPLNLPTPDNRFIREQVEANLQAMRQLTQRLFSSWPPDSESNSESNSVGNSDTDESSNEPAQAGISAQNLDPDTENGAKTLPCSPQRSEHNSKNRVEIRNRNDAFQQIQTIADYFLDHEPHSPVAYLLKKAIRWGQTPLPELMKEILRGNENVLSSISNQMGINESLLPSRMNETLPVTAPPPESAPFNQTSTVLQPDTSTTVVNHFEGSDSNDSTEEDNSNVMISNLNDLT